jgi:thioredoxin-like negative regulator of GroEL
MRAAQGSLMILVMIATGVRDVQTILDELAKHPQGAALDVFEFAHARHLAGDDDSALRCLLPLAELGGFDGSLARVQIAELYFEIGGDDEALAQRE